MTDHAREVHPFIMHDKMKDNKLDFRPKPVYDEPTEEVSASPKDLSVPEPAVSSGTQMTIELNPEETASAAKASTSPKANANGKQASSART